jgi:G-protein alpha subunit
VSTFHRVLAVKTTATVRGSLYHLELIAHITCSFFAEAQRVAAEDYVPSIEDIGHASEKGIMETHFNIDQLSIRISQVYGQPGHFRKWLPQFEGITGIMFCACLSDYNEPGLSRRSRRVRLPPFSCCPTICLTIGLRRDWSIPSSFSKQSSIHPGSRKPQSYCF